MLAGAGLAVEVFAAGENVHEPAEAFGVRVHRTPCENRDSFCSDVFPLFFKRHQIDPFDVIESPEISAEGSYIARVLPELAVVARLHTPTYICRKIALDLPTLTDRARFRLGALRRLRWQGLPKTIVYNRDSDPEYCFTKQVDGIHAPSQAIADCLIEDWDLAPSRISVFPNPFSADSSLLELPEPKQALTIGFLGRLEARKGVVEIARAIPRILKYAPHLKFRFMGPTWPYRQVDMESWIKKSCSEYINQITFVGSVSRNQLATELGKCDVIVLPSRWENFPYACWEAMASGRVVIGSAAGGMAEVIQPNQSGLLVPPLSPEAIKVAVLSLVENSERVTSLAASGRRRVINYLSPSRILPLQLAAYESAIVRARARHLV